MSHAIYLSPKAANKSALIFIKTNSHNLRGWVETQSGKAIKLYKKTGDKHEQQTTSI